ncbi:unnamed protein product [Gongylonema pulchrum]|uniref:UBR-type domain-containing protein n=1 Tax=Gongylonema pulchrum TaxID=637853 RepID=A0A3P7MW96_9BILA|nr:unnamed protein product [Gongylonema pulchrum]
MQLLQSLMHSFRKFQGYLPRQPLYSCRDCSKSTGPAALCYGCGVRCHEGHELVELYTKRNVCCDCGNAKFKNPCKLYEEKKAENERNKYNHNFDGLYCTCNRPYPCVGYEDEEMLQCIVCEDWFHLQHLTDKANSVDVSEVEEVICRNCVAQLSFLLSYADDTYKEEACVEGACKLKCLAPKSDENEKPQQQQARSLFFSSYEWRNRLCKCNSCLSLYEDNNVPFLTDLADTLQAFVASHSNNKTDKTSSSSDEDRAVTNALIEAAGRDGAILLYQGYEEMKGKLMNHLKRVADEGRVVKKEDIEQFFEQLGTERKRRRENFQSQM